MKQTALIVLLGCSTFVQAEGEVHYLNSDFNGMDRVDVVSVDGEFGQTLRGILKSEAGKEYSIPDVCEPEGGGAELVDTYTVKGKDNYFLFTCAWPVQHAGIGLNGIQYETFVYAGKALSSTVKNRKISRILSGYEGSLEGGASSYAWYVQRVIASEKILELEGGIQADSVMLVHRVVLNRLKGEDYHAIKNYLSAERVRQLFQDFPISKSTMVAYNDIGYALGLSGDGGLAYEVLSRVEKFVPDRVVLKLNIADVLWVSDKVKSKAYYEEYVELMKSHGKEKLIPAGALERSISD